MALARGDNTPETHLDRNPVVGTKFLADELRRQFSEEKAKVEDCLAMVVVIGGHIEVVEHIIR